MHTTSPKIRPFGIAFVILIACLVVSARTAEAAGASRPVVRYGTLCAADGNLLRGMPINIGLRNSAAVNSWATNLSNLRNFRDQLHENAVRICFFDGRYGDSRALSINQVTGYADAIVNNAESLGIYVIIDYHSALEVYGTGQAWDPLKWWAVIAPRYKDRTCVIYELLNEPCSGPPGTMTNDSAIYAIVRKAAPNTPVVHISTMQITGSWVTGLITLSNKCGFDWKAGKDVFGYHTYAGSVAASIKELQAAGIPSICTEWGYAEDPWKPATLDGYVRQSEFFERNCMSAIDWHDWGVSNPLDHGLNLLLPDAIARKYAWWLSTPSAPTGVSAQVIDAAAIRLTWGQPADTGNGLIGYLVFRNGQEIAQLKAGTFDDTGLSASTAYQYQVATLCVGAIQSPKSAITSVAMPADAAPPTIALASGTGDGRMVRIVFSEPVEQGSAQAAANYSIDNGVLIASAVLGNDQKTVLLTTSPLAKNVTYTLTVNNVRDRASSPNSIAPNTRAGFAYRDGITRIRLYARPNYSVPIGTRLIGGTFEATGGSPTSGPYTVLATIPLSDPIIGWADITTFVNIDTGFQFVRFRLSPFARCNVADLEFWSGDRKAAGTPFGSAITSTNDFSRAFDGNTATYFDCSQSDSSYAGLQITGWAAPAGVKRPMTAGVSPSSLTINGHRIIIALPIGSLAGEHAVSMYDSRGTRLETLTALQDKNGRAEVSFDKIRALPSGQYIVAVKSGKVDMIRAFAIAR